MAYAAKRSRPCYTGQVTNMPVHSASNFFVANVCLILMAIVAAIVTFLMYAASMNVQASIAGVTTIITVLAAAYVPRGIFE